MKNTLLLAAAALMAACTPSLKVEVTNGTDIARTAETVEIAWKEVATLDGVTPETVIVLNAAGEQIPSQVIFRDEEPRSLIFQVAAEANATDRYAVKSGIRNEYPQQAFGRQVPERYDDYAWENNKVAYRLYGPALETSPEKLVTPGIDVWVKCTDKLVIDEWYARGHYHHNYGDGMDCYKVGVTLGGGSCVPFIDGEFRMPDHNYASYRTLDNGPIRTTVELTYAPVDIDGTPVSLVKTISLDANQRFNRMEVVYTGADMPVAAGFIRHNVKETLTGAGWLAICEETSDTKDPERDGDIYGAVILPGAQILPDTQHHAVAVTNVESGVPMVYYAGTGWSQGGVENMTEWLSQIEQAKAAVETPLQVVIK